jgi:hypothetical protein
MRWKIISKEVFVAQSTYYPSIYLNEVKNNFEGSVRDLTEILSQHLPEMENNFEGNIRDLTEVLSQHLLE